VLQRTLDELKKRWKQKPAPTYNWMCSQFKSLRQDLTVRVLLFHVCIADDIRTFIACGFQVQRIKNQFTVTVYEIHARIALETVYICSNPLRTQKLTSSE